MGIARKNTSTATNLSHLPKDDHMVWQPIFAALAAAIGEAQAFAWFGHCRFVEREWDQLTLSHWSSFAADEALRRHGYELAKAAGVKRVKIHHSGGFKPDVIAGTPRQRRGWTVFFVPDPLKRRTEALAAQAVAR